MLEGHSSSYIIGNKAKGRISKWVFQEKARQIFRKTNISYPLIRTYAKAESEYLTVLSSAIRQKGKSQNGCFKKNKARQIFGKTSISYPLIRTYAKAESEYLTH